MRNCSIRGCPGDYERKRILYTIQTPSKQVIVISGVPADVCSVCGDTLFTLQTSRGLDKIVREFRKDARPKETVPLRRFA